MYEGRVTDLAATIASLCACAALPGRASWAGRVRYISSNSSDVATHKRATPKTSRFSRADFGSFLLVPFCNFMSIPIIDARRPALVTAAGFRIAISGWTYVRQKNAVLINSAISRSASRFTNPFPHDPQRCTILRHCAARRQRVDSIEQQLAVLFL